MIGITKNIKNLVKKISIDIDNYCMDLYNNLPETKKRDKINARADKIFDADIARLMSDNMMLEEEVKLYTQNISRLRKIQNSYLYTIGILSSFLVAFLCVFLIQYLGV